MEHRVYTYTPRSVLRTPRRRRRHIKKRHRISPIFRLTLFGITPILVLLMLRIGLPVYFGQITAHAYTDADTPATFEATIAEENSIADTLENNLIVSVETTSMPASTSTEAGGALGREYDFSAPVPESSSVEDSYFDDAVFIGDSRTEGLILNTGLSNTTAYAYKGLMVDTVFTKPVINQGGQKRTVMDALKSTQFSKVYIMLGINETGWVCSQTFQSKYGDIIDSIREINPNAIIYVQGIMPVSNKVSSTHSYITNTKITEYNLLLRELAEDKQVCYVDTENALASADGSLPADAATDGIHLVKDYCEKWLDYLKTHTASQYKGDMQ